MAILIPDFNSDIPPNPFEEKPVKKPGSKNGLNAKTVMFYIAGSLLVAASLFLFTTLKKNNIQTDTPLTQNETNDIIKKVSSIIEIPNETPTIITVTDLNKIKNNQFFNKADIGDLVLIFSNNKKAFLYRPGQNRIIEVGKVQDEGAVAGEKITADSPSPISPTHPLMNLQPTATATSPTSIKTN